jgi:hypothetical protein
LAPKFDTEFKLFMKYRGFELDNSIFEIRFNEPQNFAAYRDIELNSGRIAAFSQINQTEYLSKRFMLKKYLGLSDLEMAENDRMWHEERGEDAPESQLQGSDLRNVGITPGGINTDLDTISDIQAAGDQGAEGAGGAPVTPTGEVGAGGTPSAAAGTASGGGQTAGAALGGA